MRAPLPLACPRFARWLLWLGKYTPIKKSPSTFYFFSLPMPNTLPTKNFGKSAPILEPVDLNEIQLKSYGWFLDKGLKELFEEVSPIYDHTAKELPLHF